MTLQPQEVTNWGRWGVDDERGAARLLEPEQVRAAVSLVSRGEVYPLAIRTEAATPRPPHRPGPLHLMARDGGDDAVSAGRRRAQYADDVLMLSPHTGTHIDALSHLWYGDQLFNGFPSSSVRSDGARRCGVEKLGPIVARGILLDLARHSGVASLDGGHAVTRGDLVACAAAQRVEIRAADVVLVRTGWWSARAGDPTQDFSSEPGPDRDAAAWLAERDVVAVGADTFAFEVLPAAGERMFPVHELLLRDCGIPILECLALDALAAADVYEFLFVALPLPLVGATASPVNPIAVT